MPKQLPYFKWYPADALADEFFASLDLAERGLFHACLDFAWMNDGLPEDPLRIAKFLHIEKQKFLKLWATVGRAFPVVVGYQGGGRRRNSRQELERGVATKLSLTRAESAKVPSNCSANATYARMSMSMDASSSLGGVQGGIAKTLKSPDRCQEWLRAWPRVGNPQAAVQAWISVVCTAEDEAAAFAARDRYLASDEVARNVIQEPAKWLYDQARGGWQGKWPAAKKDSRVAAVSHRLHEAPRQYSQAEIDAMAADDDPRIRQVAEELSQMRVS